MFEAIAPYQAVVAKELSDAIQAGRLGQSNLFCGPKYSLRMTTALELARVLSCAENGASGCRCPSCMKFSDLSMDNVVVISQRDHRSIIESSISLFEKNRTEFSRIFLIRNVRICLLSYHGALLSTASQSQNAAYEAAGAVDDLLHSLSEEERDIPQKKASSYAKDLRMAMKALFGAEKKDTTLSVAQTRAIDEWSRETTADGRRRFVIIEDVEDANVGARNSLLKILEEPPEGVYFTLVSAHAERIMQTILSRVRKFVFSPLSKEQVNSLLQPCFLSSPVDDFECFFLSFSGIDTRDICDMARRIADSTLLGRELPQAEFDEIVSRLTLPSQVTYFLERLLGFFEDAFLSSSIDGRRAEKLERTVSKMQGEAALYNQNSKLLLQNLYLHMMEG
jgi:DNA polymerase-3 subunit gamma/tau